MVLPLALTRNLPVGSKVDAAAHAAQRPRRRGSLVWRSRHVTAGSGMAMRAELPDALRRHRRQACKNAAAWSRLVDDVRTQGGVHRPITNPDSRSRIADRGRGGPGNPGDREHLRVVPVVDAPASAPRGRQAQLPSEDPSQAVARRGRAQRRRPPDATVEPIWLDAPSGARPGTSLSLNGSRRQSTHSWPLSWGPQPARLPALALWVSAAPGLGTGAQKRPNRTMAGTWGRSA